MPHGMIKQAPSVDKLQGEDYSRQRQLYGMWKAPEPSAETQTKCKAFGVEEIKTLVSS